MMCAILTIGPSNATTDAALSIITRNDQKRFQIGEVIPLVLSFTAETAERFSINLARYDRSGRMGFETFAVNPRSGTVDPLAAYFGASTVLLGGGLTNFEYLSATPVQIHLQLNEWVRFDRPGTYRICVTSSRVADDQPGVREAKPIELTSNTLTLEIVPAGPGWQRAELDRIREALAHHPPPAIPWDGDPERTMALKALRYLGTPDAAREMARLFSSTDSNTKFECMLGLIGSPSRADGLKEMRQLLAAPDFPVEENFLSTMSLLSLDPSARSEELQKGREENLNALSEELFRVLPRKTGTALAISMDTALGFKRDELPPEIRQSISEQVAAVFESLTREDKFRWLGVRWNQVKGPEWIVLLRKISAEYSENDNPNQTDVSAAALKDWYEVDPSSAREAILAELERPRPRFGSEILGILPDKSLPYAEQAIATHFVKTVDWNLAGRLAGLLFRYADRDVLPTVLPNIEQSIGVWPCELQAKALAYVLKVDEATATPLIGRAMGARTHTACWKSVLLEAGSMQPAAGLEDLAINSLYDTDAELAMNSANYLARFGSREAQPKVWQRYVDWSLVWKGRDTELRFSPLSSNPHLWDANLGQALARALASGQAWFADEQQLHRIKSLGTDSIQQQLDADLNEAAEQPVQIAYEGFTPPRFRVAQYDVYSLEDLEAKLQQFPRDTAFVFSGVVPPDQASLVSALKTWLGKTGINISGLP
jgi:hypothetical protein